MIGSGEDIKQQSSSSKTMNINGGNNDNNDSEKDNKSKYNLDGDDIVKQMLNNMEKPPPLAIPPKIPSKCPLFCCFYAEFDIKVGPKIFFQCPEQFMDQEINISTSKIHDILSGTFSKFVIDKQENNNNTNTTTNNDGEVSKTNNDNNDDDNATRNSSNKSNATTTTNSDITAETKSSTNNGETDGGNDQNQVEDKANDTTAKTPPPSAGGAAMTPAASTSKDGDNKTSAATAADYDDDDNFFNATSSSELSIFDSTSEYIITGNELTGKIVTLSTHNMHVMTRPTLICDERYERNSLLFSVGIVLRRGADPRPFRPLISKLALTLRSMEIESQFLSNPITRNQQLQPLLERVLISLNSSQWECNLLVSPSNTLNLKLYHPPKPEASLVYDHQVPILLRKDLQLQMYDWDLAINWVILHIDGATNARQISIKAEVDLEIVLACLRVLKHHGVIDLVDMFLYSNRYEFTDKATSMLAGKESRIIQDAVEFVMKRQPTSFNTTSPSPTFGIGGGGGGVGVGGVQHGSGGGAGSDFSYNNNNNNQMASSQSSSYPPRTMSLLGGGSHKSSNFRFAMMAAAQSMERESSMTRREDQRVSRAALAELYCACNRSVSFGDLWVSLTAELPTSLSLPDLQQQQQQQKKSGNILGRKNSNESDFEQQQVRDPLDTLGLSPMETFHIESLRRSHREDHQHQQKSTTIDWNDFFTRFDHRRFCSFGQVYGLLRRVHDYPYFPGTFPDLETPLQNPSTINLVDVSSTSKQATLKEEFVEEKHYALAKNIASKMDGTRCDDELVCWFEKPYNQLVNLVEKFGKKKILSIYATTSGS